MTLGLFWSGPARRNLQVILDYIGFDNEAAAVALKRRIDDMVATVRHHPELYRPGRVPGTREIVVHPNYLVVYRVAPERIEIVAVLHTRRQYPH